MKLYLHYLSILFKSQMQYRASFWMLSLSQFLVSFTMLAGMYFLFDRFGQIKGWQFHEAALTFGVVHLAFSVSECIARGFDTFSTLVSGGDFDRLLVRPRGTVLQVIGSKFEFTRIGRLAQSLLVLGWAVSMLPIEWSLFKIATLVMMIVSGVCIFTGIFILAATMCFWTVQGLEIANIFTDGGREISQYPLNIYEKWVTRVFTFIIPFACVNYWPLLVILDKAGDRTYAYAFTPLAGILFLIPCLLIWRFGVRHYRSAG